MGKSNIKIQLSEKLMGNYWV